MATSPLLGTTHSSIKLPAFPELSQYLLAVLRSTRFQILTQLTQWKKTREFQKTAIYRSRCAALFHIFIHLIPLAAAMSLATLNIRTTVVGSVSTNVLTAIQFAAKLLEVLIQASITAVVLAYVRNKVLDTAGFPIGGIIAPYRTTDISSLWSLELWGCLSTQCISLRTRAVLCGLLPSAVILAALVGPSTAVLMIPRPINYLASKGLIILDQPDNMYPLTVGLVNGSLQSQSQFDIIYSQFFYNVIKNRSAPISDQYGLRDTWNITFWPDESVQDSYRMLATAPTTIPLQHVHPNPNEVVVVSHKQPFVDVDCRILSESMDLAHPVTEYVDFGSGRSPLNNIIPFSKLLPDSPENASDSSEAIFHIGENTMIWNNASSDLANNSLVLAYSRPTSNGEFSVATCIINAYWATLPSNMSHDGLLSNTVFTSSDDNLTSILARLTDKAKISLDPQWAKKSLTIPDESPSDWDKASTQFRFQGMLYALALSYIPQLPEIKSVAEFSKTYSTTQNESDISSKQYSALLSYIDSNKLLQKFDNITLVNSGSQWTHPATLVQLQEDTYAPGYGYNTSELTVKLSLAVIMFYLAAVSSYLIYTMITGVVATSWDSVGELVHLALNSERPKDLGNTSVGIDTLDTFRKPVNIRVNHEDSLEIVFENSFGAGNYRKVQANERY